VVVLVSALNARFSKVILRDFGLAFMSAISSSVLVLGLVEDGSPEMATSALKPVRTDNKKEISILDFMVP
jgi:hypothetical protein